MKIQIEKDPISDSVHLRITMTNHNYYNFLVPKEDGIGSPYPRFCGDYNIESMRELHKLLDGFLYPKRECRSAHSFYEKLVCDHCGQIEDI